MRKGKSKMLARVAVAATATFAVLFTTPGVAEAVTVRPGAKAFQIDVMLDDYETEQARRSYWAATVTCWNTGLMGQVTILTQMCQAMVTVCAAISPIPTTDRCRDRV
jgi:hypothetical protein